MRPSKARLREQLEEQERLAGVRASEAERLRAKLAQVCDALDALPIGVVVRDGSGSVVARNPRSTAPTGDIQADAIVRGALDSMLASGGIGHETVELHGPPRRSVEVGVSPLPDGGVVVVVEDASERMRLDSVRRDFVDNVSHELRTPIGALGVLAEAIELETDPEVIKRLVGRMTAEVERAHVLIEDLLELSRVETRPSPSVVPVDLAGVVEASVQRVMQQCERCEVRVDVGEVADVVVQGDRSELVSAVANLLDNAVKYSEPGSSVDVSVRVADDAAEVVVQDRGIGIPSRDLDRVFERFYRVDKARDRRTGGSGLGLAIVRHVAANHGGDVTVSSVEGVGSTFTLRVRR